MLKLLQATALLLGLALASTPAMAQTPDAPYPVPPPPAPAELYIPPPPPPPPAYLPTAPAPHGLRLRQNGHLRAEHSDVGLGFGEALGASGMQLAATGVLSLTAALFVLYGSETADWSDDTLMDGLLAIAILAPPLMALPSSALASKISKRCPREHSWGFTYLVGVAGSAATVAMASAWLAGAFGSDGDTQADGFVASLVIGAFLTGGLEALVLNLSGSRQVAVAPLVLKDGGGVAAGATF